MLRTDHTDINSLIAYIKDIKPFHTKLTSVVVEYVFRDDISVAVSESHRARFDMRSMWEREYISNGITNKFRIPATQVPHMSFGDTGSKHEFIITERHRVSATTFRIPYNNGIRLFLNGELLVEGVDYSLNDPVHDLLTLRNGRAFAAGDTFIAQLLLVDRLAVAIDGRWLDIRLDGYDYTTERIDVDYDTYSDASFGDGGFGIDLDVTGNRHPDKSHTYHYECNNLFYVPVQLNHSFGRDGYGTRYDGVQTRNGYPNGFGEFKFDIAAHKWGIIDHTTDCPLGFNSEHDGQRTYESDGSLAGINPLSGNLKRRAGKVSVLTDQNGREYYEFSFDPFVFENFVKYGSVIKFVVNQQKTHHENMRARMDERLMVYDKIEFDDSIYARLADNATDRLIAFDQVGFDTEGFDSPRWFHKVNDWHPLVGYAETGFGVGFDTQIRYRPWLTIINTLADRINFRIDERFDGTTIQRHVEHIVASILEHHGVTMTTGLNAQINALLIEMDGADGFDAVGFDVRAFAENVEPLITAYVSEPSSDSDSVGTTITESFTIFEDGVVVRQI